MYTCAAAKVSGLGQQLCSREEPIGTTLVVVPPNEMSTRGSGALTAGFLLLHLLLHTYIDILLGSYGCCCHVPKVSRGHDSQIRK
jgi:hypothetical protein